MNQKAHNDPISAVPQSPGCEDKWSSPFSLWFRISSVLGCRMVSAPAKMAAYFPRLCISHPGGSEALLRSTISDSCYPTPVCWLPEISPLNVGSRLVSLTLLHRSHSNLLSLVTQEMWWKQGSDFLTPSLGWLRTHNRTYQQSRQNLDPTISARHV